MDARPNGIALHSQQSLASIDVADERINFSGEPVENGIVDPGLLDEFKLPFDVAVETDEMQAPLLPVLDQRIGRAGSVGAAAAEQPVPASAGQRILRIVSEGIARISAAHVSAEGAGKPVRIELRVLEVVFVSQVRTILTGRLDLADGIGQPVVEGSGLLKRNTGWPCDSEQCDLPPKPAAESVRDQALRSPRDLSSPAGAKPTRKR